MFSLNATMPVLLMMVLGYLLHKTPLLDDSFANKMNNFVFKVALPVQLFKNLADSDFHAVWDTKIVIFSFVVSLLSILILLGISLPLKRPSLRAEFTQSGYRSSQALLGAALLSNIYGHTGSLALILIGAVPLYNVAAVTLLTVMVPGGRLTRKTILKAMKGVVTNPIIIGIFSGLIWSLLNIPLPEIFHRPVSTLAATASPLGLIALGACINLKKVSGCVTPALVASAFKLLIFPALFLPAAIWLMGCRGEVLVTILIMLASPTTVTCFSMARSMGHDGTLSSCVVMLTTLFSSFTFTAWLFLLKTLALV